VSRPRRPTGAKKVPRVLLATLEAGGGHTTAAKAWAARFVELGAEVEVVDTVGLLGPRGLDRSSKTIWRAALRLPQAVTAVQTISAYVVPTSLTQRVQGMSVFDHGRRLAAFVRERGFDLVLATHMYPLQAMVIARRRGWSDVPVVGFNPDTFDTHALFAVRGSDVMCAPTEEAARRLRRHGVPAAEVRVTGYPIDRRFLATPPSPPEARATLGLAPELPLVLLSLGAEGVGPRTSDWVEALLATDVPATVAVMTARHAVLKAALDERAAATRGRTRLVPLGFRDDVPTWLAAADVVVAKAGPASTLEALAVGAPIGHVYVAGGHERLVVDFALSRGVGAWWPQPRSGAREVAAWLTDPPALAAWRRRVAEVELPLSTDDDVRGVLAIARR
jgi:UDP-N-acetylglucosamine:LPS N-acetylglucosamine transferase